MSMLAKKKQILQILVANLNNSEPQVVHSEMIADKLEMSVNETCQLLKIMHQLGMVISDGEGQKSLITREGLKCVDQEFGGTVCSV